MNERKTSLIFKAFCDENRIRILKMLRNGAKVAADLLKELTTVVGGNEDKSCCEK